MNMCKKKICAKAGKTGFVRGVNIYFSGEEKYINNFSWRRD
jgi:hypothetical protein